MKLTEEEQEWVKQLADDPNIRVDYMFAPHSLRGPSKKDPFYKKWKEQNRR